MKYYTYTGDSSSKGYFFKPFILGTKYVPLGCYYPTLQSQAHKAVLGDLVYPSKVWFFRYRVYE